MRLNLQSNNLYKASPTPTSSEKFIIAKEKIIRQLPNIYKNTRVFGYLVQNTPILQMVKYSKVVGLMLNIQRRFMWYCDFEDKEKVKILLLTKQAKSATADLSSDKQGYFFNIYAKLIFEEDNQKQFITIPLVDLNLVVV